MLTALKNLFDTLVPSAAGGLARDDQQALQLAAAVLLVEVMRSDADLAQSEQDSVLAVLQRHFALSRADSVELLARAHQMAVDAYDYQRFTAQLNQALDLPEKVQLLEYLWQVAYADGQLAAHEQHVMRKIADLLYIGHGDYINAKMRAKAAVASSNPDVAA